MSARKKRKNAGKGFGMMFHGNFKKKKEAKAKERQTGGFMKRLSTPFGTRYMVMSERKNPIKRKKKAPKPNPHELLIMGANPTEIDQENTQEISLPPGSTIVIRTPRQNPVNPDRFTSAQAIARGLKRQAPGLIQTGRQRKVAKMVRSARKHKYDWIGDLGSGGLAPGMNPGDDPFMIQAAQELYGKPLSELTAHQMSQVAQKAARLKLGARRNPDAIGIREDFTGMPSEHYTVQHEAHMPAGDYALLGKLLTLYVKPIKGEQVLELRPKKVQVVSDESARQIWFVGGDQDYTEQLPMFGAIDRGAGVFQLGQARRIDYEQRKEHVKDPDQDHWRHQFGEETGELPTALFDSRHKRLLLEGGAYQIRREGIVN